MCVIAVKERGIALPKEDVLENCFDNNSDGAGFMYVRDNSIRIEKGFETFEEFITRLESLMLTPEDMVVYHFRIATTGGVSPGNTHPFPIVKKKKHLKSTKFQTQIALAHNGSIDIKIKGDDISDTQEFVRSVLFKNKEKLLENAKLHEKILEMGGSSKFCILTPDKYKLLGEGWVKEEGIHFSNTSFRKRSYGATWKTCPKCKRWGNYCNCSLSNSSCKHCNKIYSYCSCFHICEGCENWNLECTCSGVTVESVMEDCLNSIFDLLEESSSGIIVPIDAETLGYDYLSAVEEMTRVAENSLQVKDNNIYCTKCKHTLDFGIVYKGESYCYKCNPGNVSYYGGRY